MAVQTGPDFDGMPHSDAARTSAVTTAWNIHASLSDWTGKADAKASIALSIELAVLAATIAFASTGHGFGAAKDGPAAVLVYGGIALVLLGALLAIAAVLPRTERAAGSPHRHENFIYFGSLRHWTVAQLSTALLDTDSLTVLSEQLVAMSRIAWRKLLLVKYSLLVSGTGMVLVAIAAMLSA